MSGKEVCALGKLRKKLGPGTGGGSSDRVDVGLGGDCFLKILILLGGEEALHLRTAASRVRLLMGSTLIYVKVISKKGKRVLI